MGLGRRGFLEGTIGVLCAGGIPSFAHAAGDAFDNAFIKVLNDQTLLENAIAAGGDEEALVQSRGTVKTRKKSDRQISARARKLIVTFEVSGEKAYNKLYQGAIKPGGASGITCGIGYDVGYVTEKDLREDWGAYLSEEDLSALAAACGKTGADAKALLPSLDGLRISWDVANEQFTNNVLPIYVAATLDALDNADKLSDDGLGALVSLVYNRGPSFRLTTERYKEMRNIAADLNARKFKENLPDVPVQLLGMKRLWTTSDVIGVAKRRELEALLFAEGEHL